MLHTWNGPACKGQQTGNQGEDGEYECRDKKRLPVCISRKMPGNGDLPHCDTDERYNCNQQMNGTMPGHMFSCQIGREECQKQCPDRPDTEENEPSSYLACQGCFFEKPGDQCQG